MGRGRKMVPGTEPPAAWDARPPAGGLGGRPWGWESRRGLGEASGDGERAFWGAGCYVRRRVTASAASQLREDAADAGAEQGLAFVCVRVLGLLRQQPPPLSAAFRSAAAKRRQPPLGLASLPVRRWHRRRASRTPRARDPRPAEQPPRREALARRGTVRRGWRCARHRLFVYQTGENASQGPAAKRRCCGSRASPVASSITAKEAKC